MTERKLTVEAIASLPWGAAYLREMDLVIAEGVRWSLSSGETLYNDTINHRVADFCRHMDPEYVEDFIGTIEVPANDEEPWKRVPAAEAAVIGRPRGTWAVLEMDGKYHAVMSDGLGGLGHPPGNAFYRSAPHAPDLNPRTLYAGVLSRAVYDRRNELAKRIVRHSAEVADVKPGTVVKDRYLGGKQFSKVEFVRVIPGHFVGGYPAYEVEGTRRGVKKQRFVLEPDRFMGIFRIEAILPDDLVPSDGIDRSSSLQERRDAAAQNVWDAYVERNRPDAGPYNTKGPFAAEGDLLSRKVYRGSFPNVEEIGRFSIRFDPGRTTIRDVALDLEAPSPAPGP